MEKLKMELINPDIQILAESLEKVNWETLEGFEPTGEIELHYKRQIFKSANYILEASVIMYQPTTLLRLIDRHRGLFIEAPYLLESLRNKALLKIAGGQTISMMIAKLNKYQKPEDLN